MARFNTPAVPKRPQTTENFAGGKAYVQSAKLEVASILLTSFFNDQYYRSKGETEKRFIDLLDSIDDKTFIAKAALFARNTFGMRTISHVAAGQIAGTVRGQEWTGRFFKQIARRPDDMLEIASYFLNTFGQEYTTKSKVKRKGALPAAMRRGFGARLAMLDEYQLDKYRGDGREISLIDLVNMVHPPHTSALAALMKGTLKKAETWENKLSSAGRTGESEEEVESLKKESWGALIESRKIGHMALLRNLRNICAQAPEHLDAACALLCDEKIIRKSLVLPFRYYVAMKELKAAGVPPKVLGAVSDALDIAVGNVPAFPGTAIMIDCSGSMDDMVAGSEKMTRREAAALFAAAVLKRSEADVIVFATRALQLVLNPRDSVTTIMDYIHALNRGYGYATRKNKSGVYVAQSINLDHGTNFHEAINVLTKPYERLVFFSDMQGWIGGHQTPQEGALKRYKAKFNVDPRIFSVDLAGYGTLQFPESKVFALAGFSEKIFDLMQQLDETGDPAVLVKRIEAVEL